MTTAPAITLGLDEALSSIVAWYLALRDGDWRYADGDGDGDDMRAVKLGQIEAFEAADRSP